MKKSSNRFSKSSLEANFLLIRKFCNVRRNLFGTHLVPGPDFVVDASKLPNQASGVSCELLKICMSRRGPDRISPADEFWPGLVNL
ncbi:hypothetical protein NPIL_429781 [Nephila pilipes]|uniref:Uncharacterized protein n=1 Tax=Nephila pilipes TaxID=299642 RepID=A0A8X6IRS4_NEPPI|nr:hypothetical protein NPIL_429781 [Nephila pilipes]